MIFYTKKKKRDERNKAINTTQIADKNIVCHVLTISWPTQGNFPTLLYCAYHVYSTFCSSDEQVHLFSSHLFLNSLDLLFLLHSYKTHPLLLFTFLLLTSIMHFDVCPPAMDYYAALPSLTGGGQRLRGSDMDSRLAEDRGPFAPDTWDILLIADLDKKVRKESCYDRRWRRGGVASTKKNS